MAYRLEQEPNGDTAIVIDGWQDGIAPDPASGANYMLGVNLETPGEVSVGYPITVSSVAGATLGKVVAKSTRYFSYASPSAGTGAVQAYAMLDADGHVFESTSISGTWNFLSSSNSVAGSTNKDGIAYWLGYLFKFRNDKVDYWDGSTWHTAWKDITGGFQHFAYVATNDQLYFTNGNKIGRIFAADPAAFDPTSSVTYDFNASILKLPFQDIALSLAEVGGGNSSQSTLLVGGSFNAIYPWDKQSISFALPIYVADSYIGKMVSVNQNAFIFPGNTGGRGRIYITNGSQADLYYKIPDYPFGYQDPYFEWGDVVFHRNNLLFGMYPTTNSGAGIQNFNYVWALSLSTHTTTTGVVLPEKSFRAISPIANGSAFDNFANVIFPAVNPSTAGFSYIVGYWGTGSGFGIGYSGTAAGTGNGSVLTDQIPIGTFMQKKTFRQVEFKLRSPLKAGETIGVIPYVDNIVGTTLNFSPTVTTGSISGVAPVTFQANQWLQFIVSFTGADPQGGVRLKEIRIR